MERLCRKRRRYLPGPKLTVFLNFRTTLNLGQNFTLRKKINQEEDQSNDNLYEDAMRKKNFKLLFT